MTDLRDRFDVLNQLEPPDVWADARRRTPNPADDSAGHRTLPSRIAPILVAFVLTALTVGVLVRAFSSSTTPVSPPQLRTVIVVSLTGPGGGLSAPVELVVVRPDGTGSPIPITIPGDPGMVAAEPAGSADGSRLAFVMGRAGHVASSAGDGNLYVMNADGSGLTQLTRGANAAQPAWSPDGSRLVFVRNQGQELVTIAADGSDEQVIASEAGYYQRPAWSQNGAWIAYQSRKGDSGERTGVYLIRPDGGGAHRVASGGQPAWSPDGRLTVAFLQGAAGLWAMNSDGSDVTHLTRCSGPCVDDLLPSWSPDGRSLAFVRQEDGGASFHLYVLDIATGTLRRLLPGEDGVGSPTWGRIEAASASPQSTAVSPAASLRTISLTPGIGRLVYAFGSVWVVEGTDVVRLDPTGGDVEARIEVPGLTPAGTKGSLSQYGGTDQGSGLAAAAGLLWVTAEPRIVGIDPATNEIVRRVDEESDLTNIAPDGDLLLLGGSAEGQGDLRLIDPSRPGTDIYLREAAAFLDAYPMVLVTEHWYWAASSTMDRGPAVTRWSKDFSRGDSVPGTGPVSSMTQAGDFVWVAGQDALYAMDTSATSESSDWGSLHPLLSVPAPGVEVIQGDADHLWVLSEEGPSESSLVDLDPATGAPLGPAISIPYGGPAEMIVVDGSPFVSFRSDGVVVTPVRP